MKALSTSVVSRPRLRPADRAHWQAKRARIIDASLRHFAEHGYHAARIEDLAAQLGVAKGSIFHYFGSKGGLFVEAYKQAVRSFSKYLDCPANIREGGFFEILRYWLASTEHLLREDWIPYRVALLGNYGVDLQIKREINRFLAAEDPYGSAAFVRFGLERGEVRSDVDSAMISSVLDWTVERFQDALLTEELDPGLFPHPAIPLKNEARTHQFLEVLRGAIGAR